MKEAATALDITPAMQINTMKQFKGFVVLKQIKSLFSYHLIKIMPDS